MWVNRHGSSFTSAQVADFLARAVGSSYTAATLESAYRVGLCYNNGGLWFQRIG